MKTRLLIITVVISIVFTSLISFVDARGFSPFHFRLADEIMYDDLWFYVDGSKPNFKVDKGETATFPLIITSKSSVGTVVNFHATIDNTQMGKIKFPPGVNIQLEPTQMILNGKNQTLNVTVHVGEKAPSSKYDVRLVGVWKEEGKIPDFMGTSFSLHVGRDFGDDAIPVNFFMPPIKFAKEGVLPQEIPCRNGMILILKYDDSPACVNEDTKPKLIDRGWMKTLVDVHDDEAFIEDTKKLDSVQYFLSLHPDAEINIDKEWYTVTYAESGFIEQDPNHHDSIRSKKLVIHLDYDGKLAPYMIVCGGQVSFSVNALELILERLHNPDWCFPSDQSQFIILEPEPEPMSQSESQLYNAKKSLESAYYENVNLGPLKINDVILGFGMENDTLVIDVKYRYSTSSEMDIVKKKIRDVVGEEIPIQYIPFKPSLGVIEMAMPYHWNEYLHKNSIEFVPADTGYGNNDDGIGDGNTLCSPLVNANGTEFYIASTVNVEPFEITDTFIVEEKPQFCKKTWKTDVLLEEPNRIISLWLAMGQGTIPS